METSELLVADGGKPQLLIEQLRAALLSEPLRASTVK